MEETQQLRIIFKGLESTLIPVVSVIATFTAVVLVVYFIARYRYLVSKMLIDSGMDASFLQSKKRRRFGMALVVFGFGLGMLVSYFLGMEPSGNFIYWAAPIMFAGLGMFFTNIINEKKDKEGNEQAE